jgi:hypothetical protein
MRTCSKQAKESSITTVCYEISSSTSGTLTAAVRPWLIFHGLPHSSIETLWITVMYVPGTILYQILMSIPYAAFFAYTETAGMPLIQLDLYDVHAMYSEYSFLWSLQVSHTKRIFSGYDNEYYRYTFQVQYTAKWECKMPSHGTTTCAFFYVKHLRTYYR